MGTATTSINFIFTQLKKLEENVFKPILQKMNTGSKLYIGGSRFLTFLLKTNYVLNVGLSIVGQ